MGTINLDHTTNQTESSWISVSSGLEILQLIQETPAEELCDILSQISAPTPPSPQQIELKPTQIYREPTLGHSMDYYQY
jgi:hypothetical protein